MVCRRRIRRKKGFPGEAVRRTEQGRRGTGLPRRPLRALLAMTGIEVESLRPGVCHCQEVEPKARATWQSGSSGGCAPNEDRRRTRLPRRPLRGLLAMTWVGVKSLRSGACHCEEAGPKAWATWQSGSPGIFGHAYLAHLSVVPQEARRNSTGTIESSELDREVGKP